MDLHSLIENQHSSFSQKSDNVAPHKIVLRFYLYSMVLRTSSYYRIRSKRLLYHKLGTRCIVTSIKFLWLGLTFLHYGL